MSTVVVLLVGLLLQLVLPASPWISTLAGVLVGAISTLVDKRRPQPQQTYFPPTTRPAATTVARQYMMAAMSLSVGIFLVVFRWFVPMSLMPMLRGLGFFLGGHGIGIALVIILTAEKTVEKHNKWLASMTPRTSLDTEL